MKLKHRLAACAATAVVAALAVATQADAAGVKVGVLNCHVSSGWGFIFGSSKSLHCNFAGPNGYGERYSGTISKFGVDVGYTGGGVLVWDVFAPATSMRRGALQGDYAGATASASAGVGVGANALIGGLDRSIALQPVSIEGNTGLNVAAGVGNISLHYVGTEGPARVGMNAPPPPAEEQGPPPPPPPGQPQ